MGWLIDAFSGLDAVLKRHFYRPDLQAIHIALGVLRAHQLDLGDPPWLFVVAPPGSGKTAITVMGSAGLDGVQVIGDLTPSTLLSGFYGQSQPGLLEKLGEPVEAADGTIVTEGDTVLLIKDFTTLLSMRREKRAEIMSHLREVYDGEFRRDFGTGERKIWRGRVTVIAAVTPALDDHYAVMAALGERFLRVRVARPDSEEAGVRAIRQQGSEGTIRRELREEVASLFKRAEPCTPHLTDEQTERIAAAAEIVAIARTSVHRERHNREIVSVSEPEANTRLAKGMAGVAKGLASLGTRKSVGPRDVASALRAGLDCIPVSRYKLLAATLKGVEPKSLRLPRTTLDRGMEDLEALELVCQKEGAGRNRPGDWTLTENLSRLLAKSKGRLR